MKMAGSKHDAGALSVCARGPSRPSGSRRQFQGVRQPLDLEPPRRTAAAEEHELTGRAPPEGVQEPEGEAGVTARGCSREFPTFCFFSPFSVFPITFLFS